MPLGKKPRGAGWQRYPLVGGGPKDGEDSWYRGGGPVPAERLEFLDAAHDPALGVQPNALIHVYEYTPRGVFAYAGTRRAAPHDNRQAE